MWCRLPKILIYSTFSLVILPPCTFAKEEFSEKCTVVLDNEQDSIRPILPNATYFGFDEKDFQITKELFQNFVNQKFPNYKCYKDSCQLHLYDYDFYNNISKNTDVNVKNYLQICTINQNYCIDNDCKNGSIKSTSVKLNWDLQSMIFTHSVSKSRQKDFELSRYLGEGLYADVDGYINRAQSKIINKSSVFQLFEYRKN